jgi:phospholipid transport system substrate-binding protein
MHRRRLLLAALLAPVAAPSVAPALAQTAGDPAIAPLEAFGAALIVAMKAGQAKNFDQRAAGLRPAITAAFDLPTILARSIGPDYTGYSEAQKSALLDAFTAFTVASWTANFNHWNGEVFRVLSPVRKLGANEIVSTEIAGPEGEPTKLDFVMQSGAGGWQVVDILLDGTISRVAVQRSDFRALLASGGPDALVASLRRKTAQLAAGGAG